MNIVKDIQNNQEVEFPPSCFYLENLFIPERTDPTICWSIASVFWGNTFNDNLRVNDEKAFFLYDNYSTSGMFIKPLDLYARFKKYCTEFKKITPPDFESFDTTFRDFLNIEIAQIDDGSGEEKDHYVIKDFRSYMPLINNWIVYQNANFSQAGE